MWINSLQVYAASPIRYLDRRVDLLEKLLRINISDCDFHAIDSGCKRCGVKFGVFYHWYLQKTIVADYVRGRDRIELLDMVSRMDRTVYQPIDTLINGEHGVIVAIPHHGHYILSIVGLLEHLRLKRDVYVFYGSPETHAGNEVFDRLYEAIYRDASSHVRVIHDTRSGMAHALRGLREGALVIIMPDAYRHEKDTFFIPFCGRPMNVMLGTAALARKTNSLIVPMISRPSSRRLAFTSEFGNAIHPIDDGAGDPLADESINFLHHDYRVTSELFRVFESFMLDEIFYWQNLRTHFSGEAVFPEFNIENVGAMAEVFLSDPRMDIDFTQAVHLA